MGKDKHEQEFKEYLGGESTLSKAYQRASSEQAPTHMDDAVLAASRRAVKSKPRYAFSPFAADWHIPLSLAAILVLSVSVIVTMQNNSDESSPGAGEYRPQSESNFTVEGKSAIAPRAKSLPMKDYVNEKHEAPTAESGSSFANVPAPMTSSATMERQMELSGQKDKIMMQEENETSARQRVIDMSDMPASSEPVEQSYASDPRKFQILREPQKIINSDEKTGQRLLKGKQRRKQNSSINKKSIGTSTAIESDSEISKTMLKQLSEDSLFYPATSVADDQRLPENWLNFIAQLWADGDSKEAVQQLRLFYQRYPDYDRNKLGNTLAQELIKAAGSNQ